MSKDTVKEKEMDPTPKETIDETNPDRAFQEEKLKILTILILTARAFTEWLLKLMRAEVLSKKLTRRWN